MKLNQISKGSGEQTDESLRAVAVAEFYASCPVAPYLEFYQMTGNADSPRKADALINSGDKRTISTGYTAKSNTPGFGSVALKIYGDLVETDIAYERRGQDIGSQRVKDLVNFSRGLGRYFTNALINDELDSTSFSGLKEQADALSRKIVFDTENGGVLPSGNVPADKKQQDKFLELLNREIYKIPGGPSCIIAPAEFIARIESIGRSFVSTLQIADIFGANQKIVTYSGIPLINAGYASNGTTAVIPITETQGNSTNCTSIYLVKFGEEQDITIATNIGMDVKNLGVVGTKYQTLVEFDVDLVVLNEKALTRIAGIILAQ